ncbi:MAG TPA: secretory protein [Lachnospiraceae bacterium]|nr:secretory protein [Lachnospiraceae bacterium]
MKKIRKAGCGLWLLAALLLAPVYGIRAAERNVQTHTPDEIRRYIQKSGASVNDPVIYTTKPSITSPYKAGELSGRTVKSALNMLNQVRYIAGLDAHVTLDAEYNRLAQAAALVNAANPQLSHDPARPSGMKKSLFRLGSNGSSRSNLAKRYRTLGGVILNGWMYDGDSANIDRLGHRRWILNPPLKKTGMGYAGDCSALYILDWSGNSSYKNVAWPARNMPLEYFGNDYPWSLSTDDIENINTVKVTLIRQSDKKKWVFSRKKSNGYFNVNNDRYGQAGCIIFRPDGIRYESKDRFTVTVSGTKSGTITYTVNFFSLADQPAPTAKPNPTGISKITAKKKGFTVKWEKAAGQVTGYEIAYSASKKFPGKNTSIVIIEKNNTVSLTLSGLKAKTKYYVRIRTYKTTKAGGKTKKTYSGWSKAQSITTKK